tara:strand:- start:143 stop:412 length:270 start_codon:yes stop_codon:yes gene_type:complete
VIPLYPLRNKIIFIKVTEINSESVEFAAQAEISKEFEEIKKQEVFLSRIFSLINKNPNYKMLGALGMMLVNFSVCVTIANWLKHSSLVS